MTPERLDEIEAREEAGLSRRPTDLAMVRELVAEVRRCWAERDAADYAFQVCNDKIAEDEATIDRLLALLREADAVIDAAQSAAIATERNQPSRSRDKLSMVAEWMIRRDAELAP